MVTAAALVFLVVVMMLMLVVMVTAAALVFLVVVMMVLMLFLELCQIGGQSCLTFHGLQQLLTGQFTPGSGNHSSLCIMLSQHLHSSIQLLLGDGIGTGEDDGGSGLHLVVIELTKVLHIDLYLTGIHHRHGIAQGHVVAHHLVDSTDDIGQLAHAGGLDENAVWMVLVNHLLQSLAKVAHQGAADAAGIHLGNVDACILQEATVNADFTEFIFDEHQLLTGICLLDHFLNQSGLACTQEAAVNINLCHSRIFPSKS